jgi:ATP-binding cassette subfamily B protein
VLTTPMTLGDLLALNSYVWMVLHPALRLTSFAGEFAQIGVSIERISEVLREVPEIRSAPDAPPIHAPSGRVEFCAVDFAYKPDEPLFRGLSLSVAPGKTVALVGHTGCGKSTLTSLLMRFWDPQGGCVRIDGTDIRSVRLNSLRELFGVVLQNPIVFDGSIAENIAYGRPEASRAEIEAAAEAAEITEFASRLPQGLDTVLGTYGVKLSLGEKQRVSIARAVVKNPRILVMDEATSSLDSECEALIQRAISRALKGRTSFVVAHRLSTIVAADLIVVLDAGRIMETGRHDELMAVENGRYRKLYDEMRGAAEPGGGAT